MPQKRSKKKWLKFDSVTNLRNALAGKNEITRVYVRNIKTGCNLGTIVYFICWRQYVWFPSYNIQMSAGCLRELSEYLDKLNSTKGCYKKKEVK